jgi:hypothetical protein
LVFQAAQEGSGAGAMHLDAAPLLSIPTPPYPRLVITIQHQPHRSDHGSSLSIYFERQLAASDAAVWPRTPQ